MSNIGKYYDFDTQNLPLIKNTKQNLDFIINYFKSLTSNNYDQSKNINLEDFKKENELQANHIEKEKQLLRKNILESLNEDIYIGDLDFIKKDINKIDNLLKSENKLLVKKNDENDPFNY